MKKLITYDISSPKRLVRFHKFLKNYGVSTQLSVFECNLEDYQIKEIRSYINTNLHNKNDSVRIYTICTWCTQKISVVGDGILVSDLSYQIM